ncbi:MAG: hypothetical protein GY786_10835 [Proteobacteria bacterium]|nr:hypothetical protein [Pseudomonadota bacterium]
MMPNNYLKKQYAEQVINFCFDQQSLQKMTTGLKLIHTQMDPPVFVKIEDRQQDNKPSTSFKP